MPVALPSLQVIEMRGPDAVAFAHAQFSSDVQALACGHWHFSAWLSPQGRVRCFFHLLRDDDEHLRMVLRGGNAIETATELQRFVFRSKLELRVPEDIQVFGCTDAHEVNATCGDVATGSAIAGNIHNTTVSIHGAPPRWLLLCNAGAIQSSLTDSAMRQNQWLRQDIHAGMPELAAVLKDQLLPQWLGLDRLGAISVKKGCYPGQEIIARLHFKGGNKRGLYFIEIHGKCLPEPGAEIVSTSTRLEAAGRIVTATRAEDGQVIALAALQDAFAAAPLQIVDQTSSEIGARTRFI